MESVNISVGTQEPQDPKTDSLDKYLQKISVILSTQSSENEKSFPISTQYRPV